MKKKISYPILKVEKKNLEYADLLLNDYAGMISEESAIHLYMYQDFISMNREFQVMIEEIAKEEMYHLELLGKTISLLGGDPKFRVIESEKRNEVLWSSSFIDYSDGLKKMLEVDIHAEIQAIKNYRRHYEEIGDRYIR